MNETTATGRSAFDPARASPHASLRARGSLAAEKRATWHGDRVFVTTEDALPKAGDRIPVKVGDQLVLLLRNRAGRLAALSNLCAHRGTLLVEQPALLAAQRRRAARRPRGAAAVTRTGNGARDPGPGTEADTHAPALPRDGIRHHELLHPALRYGR